MCKAAAIATMKLPGGQTKRILVPVSRLVEAYDYDGGALVTVKSKVTGQPDENVEVTESIDTLYERL